VMHVNAPLQKIQKHRSALIRSFVNDTPRDCSTLHEIMLDGFVFGQSLEGQQNK